MRNRGRREQRSVVPSPTRNVTPRARCSVCSADSAAASPRFAHAAERAERPAVLGHLAVGADRLVVANRGGRPRARAGRARCRAAQDGVAALRTGDQRVDDVGELSATAKVRRDGPPRCRVASDNARTCSPRRAPPAAGAARARRVISGGRRVAASHLRGRQGRPQTGAGGPPNCSRGATRDGCPGAGDPPPGRRGRGRRARGTIPR